MKYDEAREYIEDCRNEDGTYNKDELESLIIWAYDKGKMEGVEEYREEYCTTDETEWYKTR